MSDETRQVTIEEALINQLAGRIGTLIAQCDYLQLQLDQARQVEAPEVEAN